MAKYRFKTKEEFIRDGEWWHSSDYPEGWNSDMKYHVGQDVPDHRTADCDKNNSFYLKEPDGSDWHYNRSNYVLKETSTDVKGFAIHEVKEIEI